MSDFSASFLRICLLCKANQGENVSGKLLQYLEGIDLFCAAGFERASMVIFLKYVSHALVVESFKNSFSFRAKFLRMTQRPS